jgi:hypothetical protein
VNARRFECMILSWKKNALSGGAHRSASQAIEQDEGLRNQLKSACGQAGG